MKNTNFNSKTMINEYLNLKTTKTMKTMKTNYLKKTMKFGLAALFLMAIGTSNAQTDPAGSGTSSPNIIRAAAAGETIKLIDNKGTIKYMQSNNGITTITSTAGGNKTTTTWQLGGSLIEDTYIDANGYVFAITGISAIDATNNPVNDIAATAYGAAGFTLLVRDEVTGETKKLLASDLVSGIRVEYTQESTATESVTISVTGLPALTAGTTFAKLFVFRNGIKLRPTTDFTADVDQITIIYDSTEVTGLPIYVDDVIEIQYIK